jgi:hypothetical protein
MEPLHLSLLPSKGAAIDGARERQTIASAITANAILVFMFLIPRNFFFENVRRIASLATFTITNLSGTIEKDGPERTVPKSTEQRI